MDEKQKEMEALGEHKDEVLQKKLKTIGNYVHDSVPVSNNEVSTLEHIRSVAANGAS